MPIDISNLPVELPGSPYWEQNLRGYVARRTWLCAWSDISDPVNLASWVPIPYVTLFATGSSLRCTNISAEPEISCDGAGDYLIGRLTADYSTGDFIDGLPVKRWTGVVESLIVGEGRTYDDDSSACEVGLTMTLYSKRLQVSFLRDYNSTLIGAIDGMVNKVNDGYFEGFDAGKVLMEPPDIDDFINPGTGNRLLRIILSYLCRFDHGHNYFYNAATGSWTTTTPRVYTSTSFSGLY